MIAFFSTTQLWRVNEKKKKEEKERNNLYFKRLWIKLWNFTLALKYTVDRYSPQLRQNCRSQNQSNPRSSLVSFVLVYRPACIFLLFFPCRSQLKICASAWPQDSFRESRLTCFNSASKIGRFSRTRTRRKARTKTTRSKLRITNILRDLISR